MEPADKDPGPGYISSSGVDDENQFSVLRTPLRSLNGHNGVVIAADWLPGGEQAVTAGNENLK